MLCWRQRKVRRSWDGDPRLTGYLGFVFLAVPASLTGASWFKAAAWIPPIATTFQ